MPNELPDLQRRPPRKPVILWVVIGIVGLLSCLPAMMSPMLGDDPRMPRIPALLLILCVGSFPISCFVSIAVSSRIAAKGSYVASLRALCLPLINIVIGAIAYLWIWMAIRH